MLRSINNIVDDFVDRLADDIGVSLSLSGEPSPLIDRFVNACLSDESGKWITIGGKSEVNKGKHVGGFRVQIDGDGKIIKGRLKGTNVKDVKKRFDEGKNRGEPIREKEEGNRMPAFMKNKKSEESVKNTVDNSRKDANIEGTAAKETAGNEDAKGTKMKNVDNSRKDANIEGTAAKETAGNEDAKGTKMETKKIVRNTSSSKVDDYTTGSVIIHDGDYYVVTSVNRRSDDHGGYSYQMTARTATEKESRRKRKEMLIKSLRGNENVHNLAYEADKEFDRETRKKINEIEKQEHNDSLVAWRKQAEEKMSGKLTPEAISEITNLIDGPNYTFRDVTELIKDALGNPDAFEAEDFPALMASHKKNK